MQKYHFISGLPRSGSTVLTSILNQNPKFHSSIANPLAKFVLAIINESFSSSGYNIQCSEKKRIELIQQIIKTYYSDIPKDVCFNTNRGWTNLLPVVDKVFPDAKVICCVRDINSILDSFEILFKKNPFIVNKLYNGNDAESVYSRAYSMMSPGYPLRFAYDSLKEGISGPHKHKIMLIEYNTLTQNPELIMKALYNFIDEPYYNHDFNNIESDNTEFDFEVGISGLHSIRKKLEFIERESILPPDILREFSGLEVWR